MGRQRKERGLGSLTIRSHIFKISGDFNSERSKLESSLFVESRCTVESSWFVECPRTVESSWTVESTCLSLLFVPAVEGWLRCFSILFISTWRQSPVLSPFHHKARIEYPISPRGYAKNCFQVPILPSSRNPVGRNFFRQSYLSKKGT